MPLNTEIWESGQESLTSYYLIVLFNTSGRLIRAAVMKSQLYGAKHLHPDKAVIGNQTKN